tara:strand:+ start:2018 stop:2518 length:501 start_codon:yes stop_codon:yes gene_type:complete
MKKVIVGAAGYVMQIEDPGDDFEIYNGPDATFQWVDAPDNVTLQWTLEYSPSKGEMVWVERDEPHPDSEMQRKVAYGDVGAQLDMLYHDIKANNMANGSWMNHIDLIKSSIPAPVKTTGEDLSPEEQRAYDEIREPSKDMPLKMSSEQLPAWKRCPAWWGYKKGDS